MRFTRPAGRFRKAAGFYNPVVWVVGGLLALVAGLAMPLLARAEWKGWVIGGRCLFILGVVFFVADGLQYRRLMREERERANRSADNEPEA